MRLLPMALVLIVLGPESMAVEPGQSEPESRALRFLAREVPRWSAENRCFSCHNNGDAARALYAGLRAGDPIPATALADTFTWLVRPDRWDHNGGEGPFSDKRLARIQFTAALASASMAGVVHDPRPLRDAAARLVQDQAAEGSWPIEGEESVSTGSPAAYGRALATHQARAALRAADPLRFRGPIERAGRWLAGREIRTVGDASVMLLALGQDPSAMPGTARETCLALLRRGQSDEGGWGPFVNSPPENYDTALAVLGLAGIELGAQDGRLIERGRAYLIEKQRPDGSWDETTRPSGAESYAQRISTTGWAALALIASRPRSAGRGTNANR